MTAWTSYTFRLSFSEQTLTTFTNITSHLNERTLLPVWMSARGLHLLSSINIALGATFLLLLCTPPWVFDPPLRTIFLMSLPWIFGPGCANCFLMSLFVYLFLEAGFGSKWLPSRFSSLIPEILVLALNAADTTTTSYLSLAFGRLTSFV